MNTPICDFVKRYAEADCVRAHMPGHKGKGGIEKYDITEIDGFDNLHQAEGILLDVEKKVNKMYGIDDDTKILLYAPTFRDNCTLESYKMDYDKLIKALEKRFGGKWCILLRLHYKLKYANIPKKYFDKVINATNYPDMQELLCAVDIGITDYSSWMCDFVLTKKPGFLFTLDIDKYVDERGFYYPLESSPFPVCKSNKELVNNILNFDEKKYVQSLKPKTRYNINYAIRKDVRKCFYYHRSVNR